MLWITLVCILLGSACCAEENRSSKERLKNSLDMEFVLVPSGSFWIGSPKSDKDRMPDEVHAQVTIGQDFYLGIHEVTQDQWKRVMNTQPWATAVKTNTKVGKQYPATWVSWEDAVAFCKQLSRLENKTYRLPTEAEWERACRGGKQTRFSFGDDLSQLPKHDWIDANSFQAKQPYAHQVGQKLSNPYGLFDMNGNVMEWCSDWYAKDFFRTASNVNPVNLRAGSQRVARGGSWFNLPYDCRAASRVSYEPGFASSFLGFRIVLERSEK